MTTWDSRGPLGDRPRGQVAPRGNGGQLGETPETPEIRPGNPQRENRDWTDARRDRWSWLRSSLADVAGGGRMPATEDLEALPPSVRARVVAVCERAIAAHDAGDQGAALVTAREGILELEGDLDDWDPPRAWRPSKGLLDEIRGLAR